MKNIKIIVFIIFILPQACFGQIRLVLTTALTDSYYEFRKEQYIKSLEIMNQYGYNNPYVVESLKKTGPTFLESFSSNVFYAQNNNPQLRNNGINEAVTLLEASYHFNFEPEDMIIKLTGRYHLLSDYFLRLVENQPEYDAFVKVNEDGNVFILGFAMKCKYLQEMYNSIDYNSAEHERIPMEYKTGDYIKRKVKEGNFNVYYVKKLDVECNIYGSSTAPGASGVYLH